jgi:secreted trypsin-like serine protease
VDGQTASRITVVLNEQDFGSSSESGARPQTVRVEQIIMHKNYNNKNIDNDIAVSIFL